MIRALINLTVRSAPVTRSGNSANGKPYSFVTVQCLDDDYNKIDVTLADDVDPLAFGAGVKLMAACDISAYGGRIRCQAVSVVPVPVKSDQRAA